jgi:hypothetical protein
MGIGKVLGSVSPLAGAVTGKGAFGKGLTALADSGMGMLVPMSYVAGSQRDKAKAKRAERETEEKRAPGTTMKQGGSIKKMAKGGAVGPAEAVRKHERNMHKGKTPTKFAKGGSTASKRADGCATKGKTKGRMV